MTAYSWIKLAFLALCALPLLAEGSFGRPINAGSINPATVGVTSALLLSQSTEVQFLEIINVSNTATVCLMPLPATATITGTQCAAGEIPLPPLGHEFFTISVPEDGYNAVASAASTPVTIIAAH